MEATLARSHSIGTTELGISVAFRIFLATSHGLQALLPDQGMIKICQPLYQSRSSA